MSPNWSGRGPATSVANADALGRPRRSVRSLDSIDVAMTLMPILFVVSGLLILALSIPLIRRAIPMNDYYGFRVEAAFASKDRWYAINEYSGRVLAKWSVASHWSLDYGLLPAQRVVCGVCQCRRVFLVCSAAIPLLLTFRLDTNDIRFNQPLEPMTRSRDDVAASRATALGLQETGEKATGCSPCRTGLVFKQALDRTLLQGTGRRFPRCLNLDRATILAP